MMTPGYKQTPEHIAKRIKSGHDHPNWQGDDVSERGGRARALRMYPPAPCEVCADPAGQRHHVDANTANNARENIRYLCNLCHMAEDGRAAAFARAAAERAPALIEAAAAAKRTQTHCKRGHELSGDNLYRTTQGKRGCKECRKIHKRNHRAGVPTT